MLLYFYSNCYSVPWKGFPKLLYFTAAVITLQSSFLWFPAGCNMQLLHYCTLHVEQYNVYSNSKQYTVIIYSHNTLWTITSRQYKLHNEQYIVSHGQYYEQNTEFTIQGTHHTIHKEKCSCSCSCSTEYKIHKIPCTRHHTPNTVHSTECNVLSELHATKDFHWLGPLGRVSLVVAMSVCHVYVVCPIQVKFIL